MTVIENDFLKATINPIGAQLSSLINKATGTELMWQADEKFWPWHAPNLFPVIGSLINNQIIVHGKPYTIETRHGFVRVSEMLPIESTDSQAKFSLPYSAHTLEMYPFKFEYQVIYDLIDNALRVTYKVINLDAGSIYFSVGGHPAFNVPFHAGEKYEDYYLDFEVEEPLVEHLLNTEGFFNGETRPVKLDGKKLFLTRNLFDNDALIFKNLKSRQVTIRSTQHNEHITVDFPHFNYLGIWAKTGADFVCIEPWLGCADSAGAPKELKQKEAIQKLDHGHVFETAFFVSI